MSTNRFVPCVAALLWLSLPTPLPAESGWAEASALPLFAVDEPAHPPKGEGEDGGEGSHHGEEAKGPLSIRTDLALWSLIVFVVLLFVLRAFAWGPVVTGLDAREEGIRNTIAEAEAARVKAGQLLAEHEQRLKSVEAEIRDMRSEARTQADQMKADAVNAGKEEAAALVEKAKGEIEQDRRRAEEDLKREVAGMVVHAAEQVIGRKMNDGDEQRLADEALQQFAGSV